MSIHYEIIVHMHWSKLRMKDLIEDEENEIKDQSLDSLLKLM